MKNFYRILILFALWFGIAACVLAPLRLLVGLPFLGLTPGGIVRGAETLLLVAVGSYGAYRTAQRPWE
jgi:hypothetical protein